MPFPVVDDREPDDEDFHELSCNSQSSAGSGAPHFSQQRRRRTGSAESQNRTPLASVVTQADSSLNRTANGSGNGSSSASSNGNGNGNGNVGRSSLQASDGEAFGASLENSSTSGENEAEDNTHFSSPSSSSPRSSSPLTTAAAATTSITTTTRTPPRYLPQLPTHLLSAETLIFPLPLFSVIITSFIFIFINHHLHLFFPPPFRFISFRVCVG